MDEKDQFNKKDKTQYGTGSQGTQEREQNVSGSVGVQNKQGQNINQGSTTGQKGGQGLGQQNQGRMGQQPGQNLGQRQGDLQQNKGQINPRDEDEENE